MPLPPAVIVIQFALLVAVQLQLPDAATLMLPVPPTAENDARAGEIE
jgi:hypothetical protein